MAECTLVAPHLTWLRALASSPIGLTAGLDRARDFPASSKTPVPASALVVEHRCPNSQGSSAPPLTTCSTIRPNSNHLHAIPYPLHPPTQPPCRAPSRSRAARATLPHRESSSSSSTTTITAAYLACLFATLPATLHTDRLLLSSSPHFALIFTPPATNSARQHHGYAPYTDDR